MIYVCAALSTLIISTCALRTHTVYQHFEKLLSLGTNLNYFYGLFARGICLGKEAALLVFAYLIVVYIDSQHWCVYVRERGILSKYVI